MKLAKGGPEKLLLLGRLKDLKSPNEKKQAIKDLVCKACQMVRLFDNYKKKSPKEKSLRLVNFIT